MLQPKQASNRIILNTGAQYIRSIINIVVSLYSARLILNALGVSDFGIYSLIAGVVSLLSFLSNSLVVTTQRFISFHQTRSSSNTLTKVFANSLLIHFVLACVVLGILETVGPFLFNGFLNISSDRIYAAREVYQCVVVMVVITLISSPFRALLIAHENIVYTSIVEVVNCLLKLAIALWLTFYGEEKLILYSKLLLGLSIFEMLAFAVYDMYHYQECRAPKRSYVDFEIIKSVFGFAGWTLWSQLCIVGRVQGVAIVVNKFFGTAVNASYGIGMQVNGAVSFVSASISNAFSPQIVKAAGEQDYNKMFQLATLSCKYSFLLESLVVIPLFIFCPIVLNVWLGEVPEDAVLFCRMILLTSLVDLLTMGLGTANQAIGDIKSYSLSINSLKLMTIPILIVFFLGGYSLKVAMWVYPTIELMVALIRLPFLKSNIGLDVSRFVKDVFFAVSIPIFGLIFIDVLQLLWIDVFWKLLVSIAISTILYSTLIYFFSFTEGEKKKVKSFILKLRTL